MSSNRKLTVDEEKNNNSEETPNRHMAVITMINKAKSMVAGDTPVNLSFASGNWWLNIRGDLNPKHPEAIFKTPIMKNLGNDLMTNIPQTVKARGDFKKELENIVNYDFSLFRKQANKAMQNAGTGFPSPICELVIDHLRPLFFRK